MIWTDDDFVLHYTGHKYRLVDDSRSTNFDGP